MPADNSTAMPPVPAGERGNYSAGKARRSGAGAKTGCVGTGWKRPGPGSGGGPQHPSARRNSRHGSICRTASKPRASRYRTRFPRRRNNIQVLELCRKPGVRSRRSRHTRRIPADRNRCTLRRARRRRGTNCGRSSWRRSRRTTAALTAQTLRAYERPRLVDDAARNPPTQNEIGRAQAHLVSSIVEVRTELLPNRQGLRRRKAYAVAN